MKNNSFILVISIFILSGCATVQPINLNNADEVSKSVRTERDEFQKVTFINGPRFASRGGVGDGVVEEIDLNVTLMENPNTITYAIFVRDYFNYRWRHYEAAYDKDGSQFKALKIRRNVTSCSGGSCSFEEFLSIPVSRGYLEKHQNSGITMKISGSGGEEIFSIPAGYITGFLKAVPSEIKDASGKRYMPSNIATDDK